MKVKARRVANFDECEKPGDFFLTAPNLHDGGCRQLSFLCPCGCGGLCGIRVRDDGTTANYAWQWDRNEEQPTCKPSINISNGHWHGYLTAGEFIPC